MRREAAKYKFIAPIAALVLALAMALWPVAGVRAETIAADDFSTGGLGGGSGWLTPWQVSGTADVVSIGSPQTGGRHLRLRGPNASAYRDVDLAGWRGPEAAMWVKVETMRDGGFVSLKMGPPGSLSEAHRWGGEDADDEYHLYTFELSALDTSGVFRIQFESHMGDDDSTLFIDSLTISDDQPPPGAPDAPPPAQPRPAIVLDGQFGDWAARANITDPQSDAHKPRGDILAFYWGDNDDDETMYWMVQRPAGETSPVSYSIHLDMDNNGSFRDSVDRIVEVKHVPRHNDSRVDLKVRRAASNGVTYVKVNSDWGESRSEGGSRVEFGVTFDEIGFSLGSALRMYVESDFGDRAPDSGDIQWSPMTWTLAALLLLIWGAIVLFFRLNRIWLPYYLIGAVGLAFAVIFIGRATPLQEFMESSVALSTYRVSNLIGIPARIFDDAPGSLMVFVIGQMVGHDNGWTMVRVTVECSGLLETGVMSGLVGLYPAWPLRQRLALLAIGIVATYGANIICMMVIIATLHFFGKDTLFIAHTMVGRAVFFVFIISVFWFVITRPTMRTVARKLHQELAS